LELLMILLISRLAVRLITAGLLIYWMALFMGTHLPASAVADTGIGDKSMHFLGYMGLSFLFACAVTARYRPRWDTYLWMAIILLCYGAMDELSQIPIPCRHADFFDWLANAQGIAVGLVVQRLALWLYENRAILVRGWVRVDQSNG
jgi:VanZ family protein